MLIPTEQPAQRTAFCKIFTVGAGKYRSFQSGIQVHSFDSEKQEWQEVDARFREAKDLPGANHAGIEDHAYLSVGPVVTVLAGTAGEAPFLSVTDKGKRCLSFGMEGVQPVKPEVPEEDGLEQYIKKTASDDPAEETFLRAMFKAQGTVCYTDILPGVDYTCHTDGQVENTFVFRSSEAARDIVLLVNNGRNRGRFSVLTEKQRKTYNVLGDEYGENSKSSGRQQDISCDASWNQPAKDLRRRRGPGKVP